MEQVMWSNSASPAVPNTFATNNNAYQLFRAQSQLQPPAHVQQPLAAMGWHLPSFSSGFETKPLLISRSPPIVADTACTTTTTTNFSSGIRPTATSDLLLRQAAALLARPVNTGAWHESTIAANASSNAFVQSPTNEWSQTSSGQGTSTDPQMLAKALLASPNFAATSAVIAALSSASPGMLPACMPLLQAAIRQALNHCPTTTTATAAVTPTHDWAPPAFQTHFSDVIPAANNHHSHLDEVTPVKHIAPGSAYSPGSSPVGLGAASSPFGLESSAPIACYADTIAPIAVVVTSASSASRRKPQNPCRLQSPLALSPAGSNFAPISEADKMHQSAAPSETGSHNGHALNQQHQLSGPTSPSTDSGVLDLSRAGSLAGSAPITPAKVASQSSGTVPGMGFGPGQLDGLFMPGTNALQASLNLLELYQRQVASTRQHQQFAAQPDREPVYTQPQAQEANGLSTFVNGRPPAEQAVHPTTTVTSTTAAAAVGVTAKGPGHRGSAKAGKLLLAPRIRSAPNSPAKAFQQPRRARMHLTAALAKCEGLSSEHSEAGQQSRRQNSTRRFPCNQCREEFPSLYSLEQHTLARHGTYRCHVCSAQFTQRSNLQRHALKHVGFKPFECRVCQKAYYRKDHLMRHMEMGHPGFVPREHITVHLTSSESLEYLNRSGDANSANNNKWALTKAELAKFDTDASIETTAAADGASQPEVEQHYSHDEGRIDGEDWQNGSAKLEDVEMADEGQPAEVDCRRPIDDGDMEGVGSPNTVPSPEAHRSEEAVKSAHELDVQIEDDSRGSEVLSLHDSLCDIAVRLSV